MAILWFGACQIQTSQPFQNALNTHQILPGQAANRLPPDLQVKSFEAMQTVILVIHLLLAIGLIAVILVQRSEGGGLGIGGGNSGGGNFGVMSSRSAANLLTRTTAILAAAFMITSLALALLSNHRAAPTSILDQAPAPAATSDVDKTAPSPAPQQDSGPAAPTR
ncbi:preprotein translocase subunit SecG [Thalassospira profundimaris]